MPSLKKCKIYECSILGYSTYCSKKHKLLAKEIGISHPKSLKPEHKKAISLSLVGKKKSLEHRKNQSLSQKGKKHKVSQEFRNKHRELIIAWNQTPLAKSYIINYNIKQKGKSLEKRYGNVEKSNQIRLKMSKAHAGRKNHMFGRSPVYYSWPYKSYLMKSSWEVKYAQYLDSISANWSYETKMFDLDYTTYTPDFVIMNSLGEITDYIEIKGFERLRYKAKIIAFEKKYPEEFNKLKVFKQKELENLGIQI